MRRVLVAIVLAIAWSGLVNIGASAGATPLVGRLVPAPPHVVGCYRYVNHTWVRVACDTQAFIKAHFPHPELLAGVGGRFKTSTSRFTLSVVSAKAINTQGGSESDSSAGAGAYSLQDNAFFTGGNGQPDGVQFTDQTELFLGTRLNGVCVWQVDITTQNYASNCSSILSGHQVQYVEGVAEGGTLTVAAASGSSWAVATVVPDTYGLGVGHRWNNSSGSILGYGGGSEAVFSKVEAAIGIEVSDCLNDAGFIGYSVFCNGPKLTSLSYVGYAAGPMTQIGTKVYNTVETNNLIPVIGSPPAHLPALIYFGAYTAQIFYTATTTGKCWTGTAPTCM
jgi:hypothetical protein